MAKWQLLYDKDKYFSPLSFWVHIGQDDSLRYRDNRQFIPAMPKPDPIKGYPIVVVKALGFNLSFASMFELQHFIDVLSIKHMPTSMQLTVLHPSSKGPNSHWLSRLPSKLKPWRKREKIVATLNKVKAQLLAADISF